MADCCAQLRSELAALRAEVAKLQKVDENSIINKAVEKAQALLKPEIGALGIAVAGAVKQSGIAKNLADFATTEAYQATKTSRSAAVVADLAKKSAQGAVSVGEIASMKAGQAFQVSKIAQAKSAIAEALGAGAKAEAATAAATATRVGVVARAAQVTANTAQGIANAANTFASSALGKTLLLAANVLSLAGSIAGLFALYATLKIVFPRLDAHDKQLSMHDNELSKQLGILTKQQYQINNAQETADEALLIGDRALGLSQFNDLQIRNINDELVILDLKTTKALKDSKQANLAAKEATNEANIANDKAIRAIVAADLAKIVADTATSRANTAYEQSTIALGQSDKAIGEANVATERAKGAEKEAVKATGIANLAISKVNVIEQKVDAAQREAQEAKGIGKLALSTAGVAVNKADIAIGQVSQVRPISEQALVDSYLALNRVNTVEPVVNNAFKATQFQATQLNTTTLKVSGLDNKIGIQDRKIADVVKRIDTIKPPTITEPGDMSNKEVLEKIAQLTGAVGLIGLGINNIPKNIAKSPEVQNTLINTTITANCRTAQPGGCTARAIDNGVGKGLNDNNGKIGDLLKGLMQAGNTALDLDTNSRVKDLQKSATAIKQVTGSDSYPIVLPEYLLDDHIDTPVVIQNQVAYNVWLLKQIDALVGLFPIKIERTDETGNKQMLVFENIAEAIAEITGLLAEIAFDADTSVNVGVHATSEAIGAKIASIQGNSYLKSIVDYLGFQGSHKSINVPISCTPGAVGVDDKLQENELGDFLKSSTQQAIGWECTERDDLHSIIKRILFDSEIARAALYKPMKPPTTNNPQNVTGDAIKADRRKERDKEDKEWEQFKTRIKNQEGTNIDIDINERPLDDGNDG